ncbi:MAG: phosphate ABC transporter substrate-binding protein PstS [Candidatus Kapaibacterium sp.]|jgi:phosphate transport system substrate-binding protein
MIKPLSVLSLMLMLLMLASCGKSSKTAGPDSTSSQAAVGLTGAGSTFIYPIASKWFSEYKKLHPDVQVNYQSIGSGGGIKQVTEGTVDFGATDGPMNDQQLADFKTKRGCDILHLPAALGAVVPTYNIPEVTTELNFTPEVLAGIFLGKIKMWNDAAIAAANPGVKLPAKEIVVAHRSDGSGTTYVWVDYLSKVSADWKAKVGVGTSVNWPVGLGGKGNEGVMGLVKQTPYSIGYVELIYSIQNKILYGKVKNASGNFVKADLASVTGAASAAASTMPADFRVSITNPTGPDAYPISSFTWFMIPSKIADAKKREEIVGFLNWMLADGQSFNEPLDYAKLPSAVIEMEKKAVATIH